MRSVIRSSALRTTSTAATSSRWAGTRPSAGRSRQHRSCLLVAATAESPKPTAYERIGGKEAVNLAVEKLYEKILADVELQHFFEHTNMKQQKAHQARFLTYTLGGSQTYGGKQMVPAHASLRGLNMSHFDGVSGHIKASLEDLQVPEDLIGEVLATVETLRPQFEEAVSVANA